MLLRKLLPTSNHLIIFLILILIPAFVSCSPDESELKVSGVWTRPSTPSTSNAAFYLTIHNQGPSPESLTAAESPACSEVQLHESTMDDQGVMSMHRLSEIEIPSGETVELKVGGLHLMCLDRHEDFEAGGPVSLSLFFEEAGRLDVTVDVRDQ